MTQDFPKDFISSLQSDMPQDQTQSLLEALDTEPALSIRTNPAKGANIEGDSAVEWTHGEGWYLNERPKFTLDPFLHAGAYYVQEASSMIVGRIAKGFSPRCVLDLCAAPGGKSTHLSSVVGAEGLVVANEVIKSRSVILKENVIKWGLGNVVVTNSDPSAFGSLENLFDLVVVDAPCSGEGMFRKDRAAREQWSLDGVQTCVMRSKRILADVWAALAMDGVLIYSTCTFNHLENEGVVRWALEELGGEIIEQDWQAMGAQGVVDNGLGGHFYPHKVKGEGLFCAVIRKTRHSENPPPPSRPRKMDRPSKSEISELERWVKTERKFRISNSGLIYCYNKLTDNLIEELLSSLNVIYSGVEMGQMIRGELKPSHPLALYADLNFENRSRLDLPQALSYLRCENPDPQAFLQGLSLVQYQGAALGWAKGVGRRVNNNYPKSWRILH